MRLLARLAQGDLRLPRIEAFSDGVFALVRSTRCSSSRCRLILRCLTEPKRAHAQDARRYRRVLERLRGVRHLLPDATVLHHAAAGLSCHEQLIRRVT
jgi:hypothetical protein